MSKIIYFSGEDVAYLSLCDKKSMIGDEDYQDGVVLYRDEKGDVVGIEILNFSLLKENKIQLSDKDYADFTTTFRELHMLISLRDIMIDDPKQFNDTCEEWGIKVQLITEKFNSTPSIKIPISSKDSLRTAYIGC